MDAERKIARSTEEVLLIAEGKHSWISPTSLYEQLKYHVSRGTL